MRILCGVLAAIFGVLTASQALAETYIVDPNASQIEFAGTHAENPFKGVFEIWEARIVFDPDALAASSLKAEFDLASAKTGNAMYDGTLPQGDWFNIAQHPKASFASKTITKNSDGSFKADGDLTLRGITKPLAFDFTLSDLSKAPVTAAATFTIDRLAYEIGKGSDPGAEWVGQNITVTINLSAAPAGQ